MPVTRRVSLTILDWLWPIELIRNSQMPLLSCCAVTETVLGSVFLKACLRMAREYASRSLLPSPTLP